MNRTRRYKYFNLGIQSGWHLPGKVIERRIKLFIKDLKIDFVPNLLYDTNVFNGILVGLVTLKTID